jgi:hypothetical protein
MTWRRRRRRKVEGQNKGAKVGRKHIQQSTRAFTKIKMSHIISAKETNSKEGPIDRKPIYC